MNSTPQYDTINAIVAIGGLGLAVLIALSYILSRLPNTKGANDALVELAKNNREALKLQREQFEADERYRAEQRKLEEARIEARVKDDEARNRNIADLIELHRRTHERMHHNEAALMTQNAEDTQTKRHLADSIAGMTAELGRHNAEVESRLGTIERTMSSVQTELSAVKASVGLNAAVKIAAVERHLASIAAEVHALAASLKAPPAAANVDAGANIELSNEGGNTDVQSQP